ncbi:hypothetical protein BDV38DRAFT_282731 [Aspergillus pseudotamarii]|uniref:GPI anchored cell wall protein n=1 Tax=Aspergillus pseudotamarii TaxID=132259 RepID=A0A5N6SVN5_ASPPS|nr:uncharacterized protein BDV38DRAFT_282731 [Aspergillus pseudotamarii]KAE8137800.1 hypothetical protein BDV38DRAFT_282731 [Aspergillus pseudotamarii]
MRFTLSSLALLAAATTVAAKNVVTVAMPDDSDGSETSASLDIDFKIIGIVRFLAPRQMYIHILKRDILTNQKPQNGSTTSFVPNCPAGSTATITASASTATDDSSLNCDMTLVSGSKTLRLEYEGEDFYRCDMGDKSATCYQTWTTTSGTSTIGTSVTTDHYPITSVTITVAATAASVTPTASASASVKASVSGAANATSTSASASASASNTDNAAMGLPTGHAFLAAGGAAMALALAIA